MHRVNLTKFAFSSGFTIAGLDYKLELDETRRAAWHELRMFLLGERQVVTRMV